MKFAAVPNFSALRVRKLRSNLKYTRDLLGSLMNVSPETIKKWEEGINSPSGANARFLEILENAPNAILNNVKTVNG